MSRPVITLIVLFIALTAQLGLAAPLRVYVSDVNAIGVQNRDDMRSTLQTLLASRLSGDQVLAVGSAGEADAIVSGTYVTIGKVFSIDATAKAAGGKILARSFVQGESQDELIPAVGTLAAKLTAELAKLSAPPSAPAVATDRSTPAPAAIPSGFIKNSQQVVPAPTGDFIKPQDTMQSGSGWISKRLDGAANLLSIGRALPDGGREVFLAEERRISYYHQSAGMKLVADMQLDNSEKILSIDTIEADGTLDLYVSIIRAGEPMSKVVRVQGDKLVVAAQNLPYFFRSTSLAGGTKKLYAQAAGREEDFFGPVLEARRSGSTIELKNPITMPRYGSIYTFNQVRDKEGRLYSLVISPDNYLIVYDQEQKELWRSTDKFGGSELYFQKEDDANVRITGDRNRWVFMNQRIQVSAAGDILIGKNDGFWVLGNARSYKRGAVFCLVWNGSSLEEKWRTRDTQNYMPDYWYDESRNELMILQTVQRAGISTRGASSLSIKKVE